jgi:hypothetical protein
MSEVNTNPEVDEQAAVENNEDSQQSENSNSDVTIDNLMAQIAQLKADGAKNKAALDKALKEKGEITKLYRAKQTAEEQEAEAKKEADEQQRVYVAELEKFKKTAEAKSRYAIQGMSEELASKAAEAEIAGDMDTLAQIQHQHTQSLIKKKEEEWIKSRPPINAGTDTKEDEDAFLKGFNSVTPRFKH